MSSVVPIYLHRLLNENLVLTLDPESAEPAIAKAALIRRLCEALCKDLGLSDPAAIAAKVLAREEGISTTLDSGLSLPHARLGEVQDFAAVLGLVPKGFPDPVQGDLTIKAVLLFFSPNQPVFFQTHLQFLRHAAMLIGPELIEELSKAPGPKEALALLASKESR